MAADATRRDEPQANLNTFQPPSGPPPLLSQASLHTLVRQGWLPLSLPPHLDSSTSHLFDESNAYFSQPSSSRADLYPPKSGTEWGYYDIAGEKAFLTLRCGVHPKTPLEATASQFWQHVSALLHRILCDLARANGLPWDIWDDMLDGTLSLPATEGDASGTLLRLFKYEPSGGFAGEHTDMGLLTLCVGTAPGLECLDLEASVAADDKVWVDVAGPVVLVGQTIRSLSNARINAGIHRVRATEEGRYSAVFALRHGWRKDIDMEKFGGEGRVKPRQLYEKMKIGVLNINAKGAIREKQMREVDRLRKEEEAQRMVGPDDRLGMG